MSNPKPAAFLRTGTFAVLVTASVCVSPAAAQVCQPTWTTFPLIEYPYSHVLRSSALWDRDESGPQRPVVVFGNQYEVGQFPGYIYQLTPETNALERLAYVRYNNDTGVVSAFLSLPNGDLLAGGSFTSVNFAGASNLAVLHPGGGWEAFAPGLNGNVSALARLANGDIIAAGGFTTASGTSARRIAKWNGTQWSPLGTGLNSQVNSILVMPDQSLIVGGEFTTAGGSPAQHVARWNGTSWSPMGAGLISQWDELVQIEGLTRLSNNDVVAIGTFSMDGDEYIDGVARWDGTQWHAFGIWPGAASPHSITVRPNGELVAASDIFARWTGTSWMQITPDSFQYCTTACALPNGDVFFGGLLTDVGGQQYSYFARLNIPASADIAGPAATSGGDGHLDNNDFIVYLDRFFAGSPDADIGTRGALPGTDGRLDNNDFIVFINNFFEGC